MFKNATHYIRWRIKMLHTERKATSIVDALVNLSGHAVDNFTEAGLQQQKDRIEAQLNQMGHNSSFSLMIPAMPFKSKNPSRVIGVLPDRGEEAAFETLVRTGNSISEIIDEPVEIHVALDGTVFSDAFEVPDETVENYEAGVKAMAASVTSEQTTISIFSLEDVLPSDPSIKCKQERKSKLREDLLDQFAISEAALKELINEDPLVCGRYTQLKKFHQNETPRKEGQSWSKYNKQLSRAAKMTWRSGEAWGELMETIAPENTVRLSIHPYSDGSYKMPIQLVPSFDGVFRSPWFNTPVQCPEGKVVLMERHQAEERGFILKRTNCTSQTPWSYTSNMPIDESAHNLG